MLYFRSPDTQGWLHGLETTGAARSSALTRATPLIYCSANAVLKFLTRGLAFLFCSGACKLRSWSCLRVKGAARGPWSRGSLEKVQSCSPVSESQPEFWPQAPPPIPKELWVSMNLQLPPGQTWWKNLFSQYVLTEISFRLSLTLAGRWGHDISV